MTEKQWLAVLAGFVFAGLLGMTMKFAGVPLWLFVIIGLPATWAMIYFAGKE